MNLYGVLGGTMEVEYGVWGNSTGLLSFSEKVEMWWNLVGNMVKMGLGGISRFSHDKKRLLAHSW